MNSRKRDAFGNFDFRASIKYCLCCLLSYLPLSWVKGKQRRNTKRNSNFWSFSNAPFPSLILFCFTQYHFILKTIISYFRYQLIVCNTIHICLPNSTCLGHCKAMKRGSSSRRKCIITAVKARLAEEQNMHQVSMALRAFFTREMRTSQSKRKKPTTRWSSRCSRS